MIIFKDRMIGLLLSLIFTSCSSSKELIPKEQWPVSALKALELYGINYETTSLSLRYIKGISGEWAYYQLYSDTVYVSSAMINSSLKCQISTYCHELAHRQSLHAVKIGLMGVVGSYAISGLLSYNNFKPTNSVILNELLRIGTMSLAGLSLHYSVIGRTMERAADLEGALKMGITSYIDALYYRQYENKPYTWKRFLKDTFGFDTHYSHHAIALRLFALEKAIKEKPNSPVTDHLTWSERFWMWSPSPSSWLARK